MRKRTGKLYSLFSGLITQYIEYKQNIGCKTTVMECLLKRFDKLANDRNEKVLGISKDLADAWCCRFPGESEDNRYYRIIILRGFSSFLQTIGYDSYIPVLPKHQSNFVPYIYTPDEMKRIYAREDINDIDGVRISFEADRKWVHLRRSNTEPIIRVYAEAPTRKAAEELAAEIIGIADSIISGR